MTPTMEERQLILRLKDYLVHHARLQRMAKQARRTVRTPPEKRYVLLRELRLSDDLATIQSFIDRERQWLTVAHVIYGDRRNRPHPVHDRKRYEPLIDTFLSRILPPPPADAG